MNRYWRILLFAAALLIAVVPIFTRDLWNVLWVSLYMPALFVIELYVIFSFWRTIPFRMIILAFLMGAGPVIAVTVIIQGPLLSLLNQFSALQHFLNFISGQYIDLGAYFLAPLSEGILQILPLVLVLVIGPWRHLRYTASPLDFAILGAALGGGFQFEESMWKLIGSENGSLGASISPHLGGFYLLPTLGWTGYSAWFGHAGAMATLALAIGLALRLGVRRRVWWLLPVATFAVVSFEHFIANLGEAPWAFWVRTLVVADLYGTLSSYLFVAGVIFAAWMSLRIIKRYREADPEAVFDFPDLVRVVAAKKSSFLGTLWLTFILVRLNRSLAYGLDWFGWSRQRPRQIAFSLYGMRETILALKKTMI